MRQGKLFFVPRGINRMNFVDVSLKLFCCPYSLQYYFVILILLIVNIVLRCCYITLLFDVDDNYTFLILNMGSFNKLFDTA